MNRSLSLVYEGSLSIGRGRAPVHGRNGYKMLSINENCEGFSSALRDYQELRGEVVRSNGQVKEFNEGLSGLPSGLEECIRGLLESITGSSVSEPVRFVSDQLPYRDSILSESLVCILSRDDELFNNGHSTELECAFRPFTFYA